MEEDWLQATNRSCPWIRGLGQHTETWYRNVTTVIVLMGRMKTGKYN